MAFLIGLTLAFLAAAEEPKAPDEDAPPGEEAAPAPETGPSWFLNGYLEARYRWRFTDDEDDRDLNEYLSLSFGQTGTDAFLTGHVSGRFYQDLDGIDNPDLYRSLPDTRGRHYEQISSAYVDLHFDRVLETARLGRQILYELPDVVRMDGVHLRTEPLEDAFQTRIVAYGGLSKYYYESSERGDTVLGGGIETKPFEMTSLNVFYTRLRDVYDHDLEPGLDQVTYRDDLISVELKQAMFHEAVSFSALYTNLNGNSREGRARLAYVAPDGGTMVALTYRTLYSSQAYLSTALDPYPSILGVYQPYQEVGIDASRDFTKIFGLQAGAQVRRLDDRGDEGAFNRDFERYYLGALLHDVPVEGSEISAVGDWYDSDDDRFWVAEGSFTQHFSPDLDASVGSSYALYDENRFTEEVDSDVRTAFLRLNYNIVEAVRLFLQYEIEDNDIDTFNLVEIGIRYRF